MDSEGAEVVEDIDQAPGRGSRFMSRVTPSDPDPGRSLVLDSPRTRGTLQTSEKVEEERRPDTSRHAAADRSLVEVNILY